MDKHLLEYIEIKDFKCFKDFKAEGFKRVNLIGGKNNVGKTAFMEALFLFKQIEFSYEHFLSAIVTFENARKNIIDNIDEIFLNKLIQKNAPIKISQKNGTGIDIFIENNDIKRQITTPVKDFTTKYNLGKPELYIRLLPDFISTNSIDNKHLLSLFDGLKKKRKRNELNKLLEKFDSDLLEADVIDNEFKIFSKSRDDWASIFDYGDGLKYYVAYICAIWTYDSNIIFIDEIENGLHYSKLDELWEIILTISKEQNVQVFATTHSKECIESYARVSKKLEEENKIDKNDISFIELGRNRENELKSLVLDFEMFIDEIEQNHEVRGW